MGRIIFETTSNTYELEKSDEDVLMEFEKLTGVKVAFKVAGRASNTLIEKESPDLADPITHNPLTHDMLPSREQIIEYVKNHLDGFSVSSSLEHFYGYSPRYGISKEQDRAIGTYSARLLRARKLVAEMNGGEFHSIGGEFVFKKNTGDDLTETNKHETEGDNMEEGDSAKSLFEF